VPVFTEHSPYTNFVGTKRGRVSAKGLGRNIDETGKKQNRPILEVRHFQNTLEGSYSIYHDIYSAHLMYKIYEWLS